MRAAIVLGVLGLLGSSAHAQRYTRDKVHVAVELSDRAKPLVAASKPPAPALSATDAKALLGITLPAATPAELVAIEQRLAENPKQPALLHRYGIAATALAIAATQPNQSKQYLLRGVKVFKALVDGQYPNYVQLDDALFHFGYLLQHAKYLKEARAVYHKLIQNHPSSPFVPLAYLAFADYYFDAKQLADAEAFYKRVLKFPSSAAFWYATYKLAWVHVELQRFPEALDLTFQIVAGTRTDPKRAALARAARLDFATVFAHIGRADKALPALARVDASGVVEMAVHLGAAYVARGRMDHASVLYRELVAKYPADPRACQWQTLAVRAAPGATEKATQIEALAKLAAKPGVDADCRANASALTTELARAFHAEARDAAMLAAATRLYRLAAPSAETRWSIAEAEWSHAALEPGRWAIAGAAFVEIARDTTTPAARAREAALAAVLAYKNALDIDPDPAVLAAKHGTGKPKAPSATERALLDTFELYAMLAQNSRDTERGNHRFLEAALHRARGDHAAAVPVLVEYLHWQEDAPNAGLAAKMLADSQKARSRSIRR